MSLKTPLYDLGNFPEVYEPREDTFLFLDALELELPQLQTLKPRFVAEIGSGSGVIITALSQIFENSCTYFATDINPQACIATKLTAIQNKCEVQCLNMNLLCCFKQNIFDLLLFNPPYVVTKTTEIFGNGLNCSWAGGKNGRVIIDKVLHQLPNLLSERGVAYMVLLKENNPEEIIKLLEDVNFGSELVLDRQIPGEYLYIYKFYRIKK